MRLTDCKHASAHMNMHSIYMHRGAYAWGASRTPNIATAGVHVHRSASRTAKMLLPKIATDKSSQTAPTHLGGLRVSHKVTVRAVERATVGINEGKGEVRVGERAMV